MLRVLKRRMILDECWALVINEGDMMSVMQVPWVEDEVDFMPNEELTDDDAIVFYHNWAQALKAFEGACAESVHRQSPD